MTKPYRIKPKRDFGSGPGFLIGGEWVKSGFVVTDGFCNIMPGATWFRTVGEAMDALQTLIGVGLDGAAFWPAWRARKQPASQPPLATGSRG